MSMLAITRATLRRMLRDRTAMFFLVLLPIAIILIVGVTVGGNTKFRAAVVNGGTGPIGQSLAADIHRSPSLSVHDYSSVATARTALRRSVVSAVAVLPADLDDQARAGRTITITVLTVGENQFGRAAATAIDAAVAYHAGRLQAARFAVTAAGGAFDDRLALAGRVQARSVPLTTRTDVVNGNSDFLPAGFSYSTPTMLVLFVFINALAYGAAIIQTRDHGIYARAMASPIGAPRIVLGETFAYLSLTLLQSILIVLVGAVLFGVKWGDPIAAGALVLAWALVGTGAGVLSGTLFRTPEQASSIGPTVGIALGMLGGCMWPLAIVPTGMRIAGHLTPQAWAVDAWTVLLSRNGGLPDIARHLAVLGGTAAVLLTVAAIRLRHRLTD